MIFSNCTFVRNFCCYKCKTAARKKKKLQSAVTAASRTQRPTQRQQQQQPAKGLRRRREETQSSITKVTNHWNSSDSIAFVQAVPKESIYACSMQLWRAIHLDYLNQILLRCETSNVNLRWPREKWDWVHKIPFPDGKLGMPQLIDRR